MIKKRPLGGRSRLLVLLALTALAVTGCANFSYYGQAISGHWRLYDQSRSLSEVLADSSVPEPLRQRLSTARTLRDFATTRLRLPDNGSYRSYVEVGRRHVVYNVFAAPELSLQGKTWCFPFTGCVTYRGYFSDASAQTYSGRLRRQGYDSYVAGSAAYSTLGWFDDPLLSTFVNWPESRLAELIFHELAHQQLYIKGDTTFNESFATAVGQLGTELWLQENLEARQRYRQGLRYRRDFLALVLTAKQVLGVLYQSSVELAEKRAGKARLIGELRSRYTQLKSQHWDGYSGYDRWFSEDLNNAKFVAFSAYASYVPAFLKLFEQSERDFPAFYRAVAELGAQAPAERRRRLVELSGGEASPLAPTGAPITLVVPARLPGAEQARHHALDRGRADAERG